MREKVRPVSAADDQLSRLLLCNDPGALAKLRQLLPREVIDPMARVIAGGVDGATIHRLAQILAGTSLPASAVAAFRLSAEALPEAEDRVAAHVEIMRIEQAQGLAGAVAGRQRLVRRLVGEGNDGETLPQLHGDGLTVACSFNDPAGHETMRAQLPGPPLADDPLRDPELARRLWRGEDGDDSEDFSFFVLDERGNPLVLVECDARGDRYLGCREAGVELTPVAPESPHLAAAQELALRQLELITAWAGCPHLWLDLPGVGALPEAVERRRAGLGEDAVLDFRTGWVDLSLDEPSLEMSYRTSIRQGVRWGRQNVEVLAQDTAGLDIPALYVEMHDRLGRARALAPDLLGQLLRQGDLRAFAGFHQGELAGLVLTSRHGSTTYDMATIRGIEGKLPLTHILIHRAIMEARAAGQRRFHFGPLYDSGQLGAKLQNIAKFKAGFATSFEPRLLLKLGE